MAELRPDEASSEIFDRVVCGVDGTPEGMAAVRQGARLVASGGRLVLVTVVETPVAVHGGWAASALLDQLRADGERAIEEARTEVAATRQVETRLVEGALLPSFKAELERAQATLVCVGSHRHRRVGGLILGSLPTELLHDAPCAVLVARASDGEGSFPSSLVAGVDGSPQSGAATRVAAALAERFGAALRLVAADGGKGVDLGAVRTEHPEVETVPGKPVDALAEASTGADLLLLGSRGLHGLRSLGSVSERVAHAVGCSVLVVR
jgi:nucleotide-binding universal stress UspA family protein